MNCQLRRIVSAMFAWLRCAIISAVPKLMVLQVFFGCAPQASRTLHSLIDGRWQTPCLSRADYFQAFSIHLDLSAGHDFLQRETYYADSNCTQALASLSYTGSYALIVVAKDYNYKVDLQIYREELMVLSQEGQSRFNDLVFCGQSNWAIGEERDALSFDPINCSAAGAAPFTNLNLVVVNRGRTLNFAEKLTKDNSRPNEPDSNCLSCLYLAQSSL